MKCLRRVRANLAKMKAGVGGLCLDRGPGADVSMVLRASSTLQQGRSRKVQVHIKRLKERSHA